MTRNIPFREPRSSIGEEVSPLPLESFECGGISEPRVPFCHSVRRHINLQSATPLSQRPWVMSPVVLDGLDREPVLGSFRRGVDQGRDARERGVRPHVAAHEVFRLVSPVPGFRERRASYNGGGVLVLQSPVDELEVGLVASSPHMLEVTGGTDQLDGREGRK